MCRAVRSLQQSRDPSWINGDGISLAIQRLWSMRPRTHRLVWIQVLILPPFRSVAWALLLPTPVLQLASDFCGGHGRYSACTTLVFNFRICHRLPRPRLLARQRLCLRSPETSSNPGRVWGFLPGYDCEWILSYFSCDRLISEFQCCLCNSI